MALPTAFSNPHDYFKAAVDFLNKYSWIYQHSNTCFLKARVLEKFPVEFRDYFINVSTEDLNRFPFVYDSNLEIKAQSLRDFREQLKLLTPIEAYKTVEQVEHDFAKSPATNLHKMNIKKQHEITKLAALINEQSHEDGNEVVIDLGAGLGYLSELLHRQNNKLLILGLEADRYRVETAQRRQQQYIRKAQGTIIYKEHFITENSANFMENQLLDMTTKQQITEFTISIIGLHACADLTINAINLFFEMPKVKRLTIMPCCYHKLELLDASQEAGTPTLNKFKNFPLSACFKATIADIECPSITFLNRPFLRLACQQTLERWHDCTGAQHNAHGQQMFLRAIAEALLFEHEPSLVIKKKRQSNKMCADVEALRFKSLQQEYTLYCNHFKENYAWQLRHESKFHEIIQHYGDVGVKLAEALTCLQTAMQKFCENIVLYDRLCYMQEQASAQDLKVTARYEKILNEKLSPRCYVLIAEKQ